jgi:hypothetical protein
MVDFEAKETILIVYSDIAFLTTILFLWLIDLKIPHTTALTKDWTITGQSSTKGNPTLFPTKKAPTGKYSNLRGDDSCKHLASTAHLATTN